MLATLPNIVVVIDEHQHRRKSRCRGASPGPTVGEVTGSYPTIGEECVLDGPFGRRRVTYADHTASGRPVARIEGAIRRHVLPWYANTHSDMSETGRRTTHLREDARRVIREVVGGDDRHAVIFTGSGATGAVDKLIRILGLHVVSDLDRRLGLHAEPAAEVPVIFVGPREHHSNEVPWRESIAEVVRIHEDAAGHVDLAQLQAELARHAGRTLRVGAFSAGSNVTGALTDVDTVSEILHRNGALACWDFAAAGPHRPVAMAGAPGRPLSYRDAVFLSPHKFLGGPGTPGVLVVRHDLVRNEVPTVPGGGTVDYVHPRSRLYVDDPAQREEGGTPAIVESVRAGLVFQLARDIGFDVIRDREEPRVRRAIAAWRRNPAIEILGDLAADRLPIVSFLVRTPEGRLVHHNLIVALLNDLFGIQSRGGCSCAAPYGHDLLHIDDAESAEYRSLAAAGLLGLRPGWTRVTLGFDLSEEATDFVIAAVDLVAAHGWRLLPYYRFEPGTGRWVHRDAAAPAAGIADLLNLPAPAPAPAAGYAECLAEAREIFAAAPEPGRLPADADDTAPADRLHRLGLR